MRLTPLLAVLLLSSAAAARAESTGSAPASLFPGEKPAWSSGYLSSAGAIVPAEPAVPEAPPTPDIAPAFPTAEARRAITETAPLEADSTNTEAATPKVHTAGVDELAVNVPELPQIIDRMGTAVLILALCLVAALFYRKKRALAAGAAAAPPRMRVVSRIPVSRRGEVCLVEVDQRLMVVGLDAQGIRTLVPLDNTPVTPAAPPQQSDFAAVHEQVLRRREERRPEGGPRLPRPARRRESHPELSPG